MLSITSRYFFCRSSSKAPASSVQKMRSSAHLASAGTSTTTCTSLPVWLLPSGQSRSTTALTRSQLSVSTSRSVAGADEATSTIDRLASFLDFLIPLYRKEGKSYLTVTLGCTGGKHRSVAVAEALRVHLDRSELPVSVTHRDAEKE